MKFGKTIQELLKEVERQTETRKDYVAETTALQMHPVEGERNDVTISMQGNGSLLCNALAHDQIGLHVGIPARYYDRMRNEAPGLLAANVNHWFREKPAKRMVRTLDGQMRAFLSNGYRALENFDLCEAVVPLMIERKMAITSCELTERRLYIKAVDMSVVREIEGRRMVDGRMVDFDHVSPTCTISNSEVGMGALSVEWGMFTHECKNMALFRERTTRKYHIGARHELTQDVQELLTSKTKALTDAAIWSQIKDVVTNGFAADSFDQSLVAVKAMAADRITTDPIKAIETVARKFNFNETEKSAVLTNLIQGANLTRYGLFNAITRTAEDVADYDRATEFERMGGDIIELPKSAWREIAEAA